MIKTAMAFLLGCLLCLSLKEMPAPNGFLLLVVIIILWLRHTLGLAFIVGLLWAGFQAQSQLADRLPEMLAGKDIVISGEITTIPTVRDRLVRFELAPDSSAYPRRIRLTWYRASSPYPNAGEHWQFTVRLKPPRGMSNPGSFDYEKWLFTQRIGATGYVRNSTSNQLLQHASVWNVNRLRQQLQVRLNKLLPDAEQLPLLQGLAIGIRDDLDDSHWQTLRQTGTSHLLAISGLHIGLAAAIGFFLLRFLWSLMPSLLLRVPAHYVGALGGVILAAFYACLAGFTVPTQRAFVMVATIMLALVWKRPLYPLHVLAVSLLLVLFIDPFAVISAGFWLSFSAVALIVFTCSNRYPKQRWNWAGIHLWIAVGLIPLLVLFFGQISVISPIANLIAVPLVSFLVVPIILFGMVMLIVSEPLARWLLNNADYLLNLMWKWLRLLANSPISDWHSPFLPIVMIGFVAIAVILILLPRGWPAKWLALILLLPIWFYQPDKPESGEFYLSVLDVGQGLATVIETKDHVLVFDTGPKYSAYFDTGKAVVAPFLKHRAINNVDKLIVSHSDNDHIGGVDSLADLITINETYSNDLEALPNATPCLAGQVWFWNQVKFEILHPFETKLTSNNNNRSCVLKVTANNRSALLPGDIEKESEYRLLNRYGKALKADILVVPHHGSRTSSTMRFIQTVDPEYGLLAVGYRNRYRFPVESVLKRYQKQGTNLLRTDHHGAILFRDETQPIRWRQQNAKLWTSKATE